MPFFGGIMMPPKKGNKRSMLIDFAHCVGKINQ
jgi:hypothetical protein